MQTTGIFKSGAKGTGHLRMIDRNLRSTGHDPVIPAKIVKEYGIVNGARLEVTLEENKVTEVHKICDLRPEDFSKRKRFEDLVAISPEEKIILEKSELEPMRIIDLVAPIGKGTRGLIVAPPKAGKTVLLEQIAGAINKYDPDIRLVMLLIDERPEEITHFRRTLNAEVLASSNDLEPEAHTELAELVLSHLRTELECGHDVVVLVDSLTRMGRAFNIDTSGGRGGKSRTMSGGIDAAALTIPRRFFGAARNIENGGSITIIATALVDTGSRMDDFIFEEFKGTGNSEVILSRELAEQRIYPAIDLSASGTRKEAILHGEDDTKRLDKLRRILAERESKGALLSLKKLLDKHPTNRQFLDSIPV